MLIRLIRRVRVADGERGSAIVNVLVLMIVTSVVAVGMGTSLVVSGGVTMTSRQAVQSAAASDAGIDFARAQIAAGDSGCSGWDERAGEPSFTVAVPVYLDEHGGVLACTEPLQSTVAAARITSTGYSSSGSTVSEQVGAELAVAVPEPVVTEGTGPALFSYSASALGAGSKVYAAAGTEAVIVLQTGPVTCGGGAATGSPGTVSLVVQGNLTIGNGCNVTGDAWATGAITHTGGNTVTGSVRGSSLTMGGGARINGNVWLSGALTGSGGIFVGTGAGTGNVTASSVTWSSGATIWGNVETTGLTSVSGNAVVKGNVTAGSLTLDNSKVDGSGWVHGNSHLTEGGTWLKGTLTTATMTVGGGGPNAGPAGADVPNAYTVRTTTDPGTSPFPANPVAPDWPVVPTWIDYDFTAHQADWLAEGFTIRTLSGTNCGYEGDWASAVKTLKAKIDEFAGTKAVIDARGCTNGVYISGGTMAISNNVVIIANKFTFSNGKVSAPAGTRMWLITPDTTANSIPTCTSPAAQNSSFSGGFDSTPATLSYMIYTPCQINIGIGAISGQVFAGAFDLGGYGQLTYTAMGIPGIDLSGAAAIPTPTIVDLAVSVDSRYPIG
jgi:cytoskeletal protein CcmA (bactofilin family)